MLKLSPFTLLPLCLIFIDEASAEIWRCRPRAGGAAVITSNPTASGNRSCRPFDLQDAAYTELPADRFSFHHPQQTPVELPPSLVDPRGVDPRGVDPRGVDPRGVDPRGVDPRGLNLHEIPAGSKTTDNKPLVEWAAEEVETPERRSRAPKLICRISGSAQAKQPGIAKITIRRGGATVDHVRIMLSGSGKSAWKVSLPGRCRNPLVHIMPFH